MLIAQQVNELPEVGYSIVNEAKQLDSQQKHIDQLQFELDRRRHDFIMTLKQDWTTKELTDAGIFG